MATEDFKEDGLPDSMPIMDESTLLEEVELLQAIYINELTVVPDDDGRPSCLKVLLHPATGENAEQQYVCLTLEFHVSKEYPMEIPDITIKNPRGLADEHIRSLRKQLHNLGMERKGGHMLYELIELAKESLTQCNIPHGNCIICLEDFTSTDTFIKTECYHYFHNYCLLRYINYRLAELQSEKEEAKKHKHMKIEEKEVVCPVCREAISYNIESLSSTPAPADKQNSIQLSEDIRHIQQKMAALFEKQKNKGGIIDIEAEKNKYYLTLTSIPDVTNEALPAEEIAETIGVDDQSLSASLSVAPSSNDKCEENKQTKEGDRFSHRGKQKGSSHRNNWRKRPQESRSKSEYKEKASLGTKNNCEKTITTVSEEERSRTREAQESVKADSICDASAKSKLPNPKSDSEYSDLSTRKDRKDDGSRNKSTHGGWGRDAYRRNDRRDGRTKPGESSYKGRERDRVGYNRDTCQPKSQAQFDTTSDKKYPASNRRKTNERTLGNETEKTKDRSQEPLKEHHGKIGGKTGYVDSPTGNAFPIQFNHGHSSKNKPRNASEIERKQSKSNPPGFRTVGPPPGFKAKQDPPDFEDFR